MCDTIHIHSPMKMEQRWCSETSAIKHHMLGNNPKDYTQLSEHDESLKSRKISLVAAEVRSPDRPVRSLGLPDVDTSSHHGYCWVECDSSSSSCVPEGMIIQCVA
jgi:hypothetical protein